MSEQSSITTQEPIPTSRQAALDDFVFAIREAMFHYGVEYMANKQRLAESQSGQPELLAAAKPMIIPVWSDELDAIFARNADDKLAEFCEDANDQRNKAYTKARLDFILQQQLFHRFPRLAKRFRNKWPLETFALTVNRAFAWREHRLTFIKTTYEMLRDITDELIEALHAAEIDKDVCLEIELFYLNEDEAWQYRSEQWTIARCEQVCVMARDVALNATKSTETVGTETNDAIPPTGAHK